MSSPPYFLAAEPSLTVMLLFPFQYNYVDFKFFPARDAGAEVKVFVWEFSILGPDAPVTIAGGNSNATVAGSYEDRLISGLDVPQAPELLPGVIHDVLSAGDDSNDDCFHSVISFLLWGSLVDLILCQFFISICRWRVH